VGPLARVFATYVRPALLALEPELPHVLTPVRQPEEQTEHQLVLTEAYVGVSAARLDLIAVTIANLELDVRDATSFPIDSRTVLVRRQLELPVVRIERDPHGLGGRCRRRGRRQRRSTRIRGGWLRC